MIFLEKPCKLYTNKVATLWYRAPEILLEIPTYSEKTDMWSIGCIFAELLNKGRPILPGKSELHQFEIICDLIGLKKEKNSHSFFSQFLGYPTKKNWEAFHKNMRLEYQIYENKTSNNIEKLLPNVSLKCLDLLKKTLCWDPENRISVHEAMNHPYFYDHPRPALPDEIKILHKLDEYSKKNVDAIKNKKIKI